MSDLSGLPQMSGLSEMPDLHQMSGLGAGGYLRMGLIYDYDLFTIVIKSQLPADTPMH